MILVTSKSELSLLKKFDVIANSSPLIGIVVLVVVCAIPAFSTSSIHTGAVTAMSLSS